MLGLGIILGMNYALLAVGLVLIHRNSRLVNFAHGDIGVAAAVLLWVSTTGFGVPYWVAFLLTLVTGGVLAAFLERTVIERLRRAPRAIAGIATLGAGQLLLYVSSELLPATEGSRFPQPPGVPSVRIGTLIVQPAEALALFLAPLAIGGLIVFLKRTPLGLALRATGADPDLARASGFSAGRLSALAWAIGGSLATLAAILLFGLKPGSPPPTGLDLLLAALTASVVARMTKIAIAAGSGLALGIMQHLLLGNGMEGGLFSVALFGVVFVAFLLGRSGVDLDTGTRWYAAPWGRTIGKGAARVPLLPVVTFLLGAATIVLLAPTQATALTATFAFTVLTLSVAVMTGLSGELLLGQAAYAGLGAMASIAITIRTGNFFVGFAAAAIGGAASALVSSLPALRRRDLSLAVLSLAFAFSCSAWVFHQTWMFGAGIQPGRPIIGSFALTTAKSYALFSLGVMCVGLLGARSLWASPLARRLIAQRDNPRAAASFGISSIKVRAQALLISGGLAGIAGALLAHATLVVDTGTFSVSDATRGLGAAALGGISSIGGSVVGALFMIGIPELVGGVIGLLTATWVGWLLVIVAFPHGIVGEISTRLRDQRDEEEDGIPRRAADRTPPRSWRSTSTRPETRILLEVGDVSVSFGETKVLDSVNLDLSSGEIVGIAGANGAGKSTLLDVISGERTPDSGWVRLDGMAVISTNADRRARLGLGRSFEDTILYPTLTVLEATLLGLENQASRTASVRGVDREHAMDIIRWVGLEQVAHQRLGELSTGVRRMAQLACLCARRPRLLLLDEPASGIAAPELDGLISLLREANSALGTALLIVEHERRIIEGLTSRVILLSEGRLVSSR